MHILIADDDPVARTVLGKTLVRLGHTVAAMDNGTAAIDTLLADDGPRFAILDWMMPGADGLTVCRAVRQRPTPYVYVILLTSRDSPADMVEGLDAGADDFLSKPFDAVELRARLRSGERVLALQSNLLEVQAALEHQATHDRLTGLWNRGMIIDHLKRALSQAQRARGAVSVVMADLDHFKAVNDQLRSRHRRRGALRGRPPDAGRAPRLRCDRPLRRRRVHAGRESATCRWRASLRNGSGRR